MDRPTPLILNVETPAYGRVVMEANDGKRYHADLRAFEKVICFPSDDAAWRKVSIDDYGLSLVWPCRFEVHVDQVVGLADRVESAEHAA